MKTVLVTGGNRGIGLATVQGFLAKGGYRVYMGSRELVDGDGAEVVQIDVSSKSSIDKAVSQIEEETGGVDILVNNAGVLLGKGVLNSEEKDFFDTFGINLRGPLHLIRRCVPGMLERGFGRVINVSSMWGSFDQGLEGPAAYSISKAALNALTLATSKELRGDVTINSMCPGWVDTRMGNSAGGGAKPPKSPDQGADTILWLAEQEGLNGGFYTNRKPLAW